MAILGQMHEVGPSMLVTAGDGGTATADVVPLRIPTAAAQFAEYGLLNEAAASLTPFEGEAADALRAETGAWLDDRAAREAQFEGANPALMAYDRMDELCEELRGHRGFPVRQFDIDASEALLTASRTQDAEAEAGMQTAAFPELDADPVRALPILRYVPEDRRQALLSGLPEPLANLGAPIEAAAPQEPGLWARARALGGKVLERLHLRRGAQAAGQTAVAAEVSIGEPAEAEAEVIPPINERFVEVPGAGRLKYVSYFDHPAHNELTTQIDAGQRRQYVDHRIWKEDAEGALARGPHVEILALVDPDTGRPVVSMRKIHAQDGDISQLPSVVKFNEADAFDPQGVQEFIDTANDRPTVEIASLWKDRDYDVSTTVTMYREALHDSIERGEMWIMGVVAPELRLLTSAYGTKVVRVISKPISVNDGSATDKIRLRAAFIDPAAYFDNMMDEIAAEKASADARERQIGYQRETLLWRFLSGLNRKYLSATTLDRLGTI